MLRIARHRQVERAHCPKGADAPHSTSVCMLLGEVVEK